MPLKIASILLLGTACAWPQSSAIRDTPAGHTLQARLDAFNSGDRARLQTYLAKYDPSKQLDAEMSFRTQTGGFELLGIDKSERLHIEFLVKEKADQITAVGKMDCQGRRSGRGGELQRACDLAGDDRGPHRA
jgi:hypothetical protein